MHDAEQESTIHRLVGPIPVENGHGAFVEVLQGFFIFAPPVVIPCKRPKQPSGWKGIEGDRLTVQGQAPLPLARHGQIHSEIRQQSGIVGIQRQGPLRTLEERRIAEMKQRPCIFFVSPHVGRVQAQGGAARFQSPAQGIGT